MGKPLQPSDCFLSTRLQDVEDQATAGVDLAMADALASLANATRLQETQVPTMQESCAGKPLPC
jgi:hypothetical protein